MNENLWGMFISNSLLISATKDLFKKKLWMIHWLSSFKGDEATVRIGIPDLQ